MVHTLYVKQNDVKGKVRYRFAGIECGDINSLRADIDIEH